MHNLPMTTTLINMSPANIPQKANMDTLDILNDLHTTQSHVIYEKQGLHIELCPKKESSTLTIVDANFTSFNGATITDIVLQVAVPKVIS